MRRFADLFDAIDRTTSTTAKVAAMIAYLRTAPPGDAAWAVFFLTGRRLKRLVPWAALRDWTLEATGIESWLLEDCYAVVGDGAETMALVLDQVPASSSEPLSLSAWVDRILELKRLDPAAQSARVQEWWRALERRQRFLLLKLITGELRLGVSQPLVIRALSSLSGLGVPVVASRLAGDWSPSPEWFESVIAPESLEKDDSRPYPFYLASPLEQPIETLGDPRAWLVERKWDGIRAQLVRRGGHTFLWSRGEELITHRFPEIVAAATHLPAGTVLDGEILAFGDGQPRPFAALQQRIGREKQVAQLMRAVPVVYMAFDQIEHEGRDMRSEPLSARRATLTSLVDAESTLRVSPRVAGGSWEALAAERARSRTLGVEGLMLKRLDSVYLVGRRRGDWWKWKIDPYTIDAVLIYAQPGSGKRASLLTDYTFGVWDAGALVPIAKAYSGLSNEEIAELDRWIRRHTVQRFGPVRHVEPVHVFELGFEAIARSSRHRSGLAVRFPRMLRWRKDKAPADADTLDQVRGLLKSVGRDR
jgi:DNA ligase-1